MTQMNDTNAGLVHKWWMNVPAGDRFNTKMSSYQHRNSRYNDRLILIMGIPISEIDIETRPICLNLSSTNPN